jgi:hypothetical protein
VSCASSLSVCRRMRQAATYSNPRCLGAATLDDFSSLCVLVQLTFVACVSYFKVPFCFIYIPLTVDSCSAPQYPLIAACLMYCALQISNEIDGQNRILSEVEGDFEEAIHGMDLVTRKTKELIQKSGGTR